MTTWTTWIVSGWIHFFIGFGLGWLIFKRPEFITRWIDSALTKVGL